MNPEEAALRAHALWCASYARSSFRDEKMHLEKGMRHLAIRARAAGEAFKLAFHDAKVRAKMLASNDEAARKFASHFH